MVQKRHWEPTDALALRKQKQKTETVQKQASKHATHKNFQHGQCPSRYNNLKPFMTVTVQLNRVVFTNCWGAPLNMAGPKSRRLYCVCVCAPFMMGLISRFCSQWAAVRLVPKRALKALLGPWAVVQVARVMPLKLATLVKATWDAYTNHL